MSPKFDNVPDDIKKQAAEEPKSTGSKTSKKAPKSNKEEKITGAEKEQKRLLKYRRAGVVLSEDQVKEIKEGRKQLRKEMKARGIRSKKEFEMTAGGIGLYFDKKRNPFLLWLLSHWLGVLIGMLILFLGIMFLFSAIQQLRGHFTINLSEGMFKKGFTLSETVGFEQPSTQLFAEPSTEVPCISINQIPTNIDEIDGEHNDLYFAYTSYIRNEGEEPIDFDWTLSINSETLSSSEAVWVMLFVEGKMTIYAKNNKTTGEIESMPPVSETARGYITLPIKDVGDDGDQFEIIAQKKGVTYWRVNPDPYLNDTDIATGTITDAEPLDPHKFTVVLWIEGDDPDATNDLIGGNLGVELNYRVHDEVPGNSSSSQSEASSGGDSVRQFFRNLFDGLKFWDDEKEKDK